MLSSYGIDNAADVTTAALESVPGFGSFLIMELITWRQSLEAKLVSRMVVSSAFSDWTEFSVRTGGTIGVFRFAAR